MRTLRKSFTHSWSVLATICGMVVYAHLNFGRRVISNIIVLYIVLNYWRNSPVEFPSANRVNQAQYFYQISTIPGTDLASILQDLCSCNRWPLGHCCGAPADTYASYFNVRFNWRRSFYEIQQENFEVRVGCFYWSSEWRPLSSAVYWRQSSYWTLCLFALWM